MAYQDQGNGNEAGPSRSNSRLGSGLTGKGRKKRLSDEGVAYDADENGRESEGAALLGTNGYGHDEAYINGGAPSVYLFRLRSMCSSR